MIRVCCRTFRGLRRPPQQIQCFGGSSVEGATRHALHVGETRREADDASPQRRVGIEVQPAGQVDDRKQEVPQLVRHPIGVSLANRPSQFGHLFIELGEHVLCVDPIKPDTRRTGLHVLRLGQRGQALGYTVQKGGSARGFSFTLFDGIPLADHIISGMDSRGMGIEHMWMPPDEFLLTRVKHVVQRECSCFSSKLRVKRDLQRQISEFFLERGGYAGRDGIDRLVCLFDQVRNQGLVRLLAIPRTAVGCAQSSHDLRHALTGARFWTQRRRHDAADLATADSGLGCHSRAFNARPVTSFD